VAIIADAVKHRKTSEVHTNSNGGTANNKTVGSEIIPDYVVPAPVLDFCTIAITGFVPKPV
jgi:hypothetical protein